MSGELVAIRDHYLSVADRGVAGKSSGWVWFATCRVRVICIGRVTYACIYMYIHICECVYVCIRVHPYVDNRFSSSHHYHHHMTIISTWQHSDSLGWVVLSNESHESHQHMTTRHQKQAFTWMSDRNEMNYFSSWVVVIELISSSSSCSSSSSQW
jgi:hypothetical protein